MPRAGLDSAAVVAAAASLADLDGLDAVTLARLSKLLGVRPPSLYAHVAGLDDLRRRIGLRGARELAAALSSAAAGRSRGDALRSIADAYREYAHAHPGTYAALQRLSDPADAGAAAAGTAVVAVVLAVLRGYELDGDDAIHAVRAIRAALHGFVALEADGGFGIPLSVDQSFARLVAVLDRGFSPPTD
ncbi:MAG TPA: TetR-like C-terminal domain-containing protein [Solirubrobacteraceae bacterium]|jgi:AcrR family transcriptional regulator|nr:TetR-like C-terminal domain-containing protein [Solirubrobacteraceae bacterium]